MNTILIVNPELGWDSVAAILEVDWDDNSTGEKMEQVEKICNANNYILIDWKCVTSVESFIQEYN